MGAADGLPRTVDALHRVQRSARRSLEVSGAGGDRAASDLRQRYIACLDRAFETYARWIEPIEDHYRTRYPRDPGDPDGVYKRTIRAKALDTLRGLLPAATQSNVGLFGTGQAYEALLLRMRVHPLQEVRTYADLMLTELRKVIPSFLKRVDRPDRGGRWSQYLRATRDATAARG